MGMKLRGSKDDTGLVCPCGAQRKGAGGGLLLEGVHMRTPRTPVLPCVHVKE